MKRVKILVVGSFVMDLIVSAKRFPDRGETVLGTGYQTATGGKGANQAVQAARLGADVTMVGKVGADDFGRRLVAGARAAGVNVDHVCIAQDTFSAIGNVQLEEMPGGGTANRIIVVPGANMALSGEDVAFLEQEIRGFDMVLLQLEIPMEINLLVARCAQADGVPVMLNSAPYAPLPPELLRLITYISPNEHEASLLTGLPVENHRQVEAALEAIRSMGVENVLITLGSRGAVCLDGGGQLTVCPAVSGLEVKDPTAAGDSFVGAFCTAVSAGLPIDRAMRFANYTAALTVCRMGAQPSLPTLAEVLALMRRRGEDLTGLEEHPC